MKAFQRVYSVASAPYLRGVDATRSWPFDPLITPQNAQKIATLRYAESVRVASAESAD